MAIPTIEPQSRGIQKEMLKIYRKEDMCWIIGIKTRVTDSRRPNMPSQFVWAPGLYPHNWVPWLPVRADDPKREPMLALMMDFFLNAGSRHDFEPFLIERFWLDRMQEGLRGLRVYEFPLFPDDWICRGCGAVVQQTPKDLPILVCELCSTYFFEEMRDE